MVTSPAPVREPRAASYGPPVVVVLFILVAAIGASVIRHQSAPTTTHGSGQSVTQRRDLAPVTSVELTGSTVVTVRLGRPQTVLVRGDDNLVGRVTTTVRAGRLAIGTRGSFATTAPMSVGVVVPSLDALTLSGSGTVVVEGVSGAHLSLRVPGTGTVRATGAVDRLDVVLSGSGAVQLADLVAQDVTARVEGTGHIAVHATESLVATVTGAGSIVSSGTPQRVEKHLDGAGSIVVE